MVTILGSPVGLVGARRWVCLGWQSAIHTSLGYLNNQLLDHRTENKPPVEYGDVDDERMVSGSYDPQNDGASVFCDCCCGVWIFFGI